MALLLAQAFLWVVILPGNWFMGFPAAKKSLLRNCPANMVLVAALLYLAASGKTGFESRHLMRVIASIRQRLILTLSAGS